MIVVPMLDLIVRTVASTVARDLGLDSLLPNLKEI